MLSLKVAIFDDVKRTRAAAVRSSGKEAVPRDRRPALKVGVAADGRAGETDGVAVRVDHHEDDVDIVASNAAEAVLRVVDTGEAPTADG